MKPTENVPLMILLFGLLAIAGWYLDIKYNTWIVKQAIKETQTVKGSP